MVARNMLEGLSDNIVVNADKCTFCGLCAEKCILDNIRLQLAECRQACPIGQNCQGYVQLIARGEDAKAMEVVREQLPFPGILGRVCTHPCEDNCGHQATDGAAVSIRALKRYLDDTFKDQEPPLPEMKADTGKEVAIIGSGPAGLIAAHNLAVQGHQVTIFERESAPGGMLRWSIPEFRLPLEVVERELKFLERMGITFQCNTEIGSDKSLDELRENFDAVLIASGMSGHLELNIAGEDRAGILHGLPFLKSVRENNPPQIGKKVVIIGGGSVAMDVAQTSLRLGAESVRVVCLESREEMPAFNWEILDATAENIQFDCSWGNPELKFDADTLKGADFQACKAVFDSSGRFAPRFDQSKTLFVEADTIIVAIGQKGDKALFGKTDLTPELLTVYDPVTFQTSVERIFVAGDCASGPSSVVSAMATGIEAAESITRLLAETPMAYGRSYPGPVITEFEVDRNVGSPDKREDMPRHRCAGKGDFSEIEPGMTRELALRAASRCHSCGLPVGHHRTCWFCLPCEVVCPTKALWVEIPYLLR